MPRLHLLEIGDQPWCPPILREAGTGLLELIVGKGNYYAAIIPQLAEALRVTGATDVVDLCSGGGGPWKRLLLQLDESAPTRVVLTDKYPNVSIARRVASESRGRIVVEPRSVDATAVPDDLHGFRTLFTSLHHFRPAEASEILADAVRSRVGIGVFEFTERSFLGLLALLFTPLAVVVAVPFLRPFRWPWFWLTYVLPVIPLVAMFDGLVSCLRTYSPDELEQLIAPLRSDSYVWEIGQARTWRSPLPITYLIGYPSSATSGGLTSS